MTVAYDATSFGFLSESSGLTSFAFSHTPSGANRILMVAMIFDDATLGTGVVSGVDFNGSAFVVTDMGSGPGVGIIISVAPSQFAYLTYLVAPATGAHNITVSFPTTRTCLAMALSFTSAFGVSDINASDASGQNNTSVESPTGNADMVASFPFANTGEPFVASAGATARLNVAPQASPLYPPGQIYGQAATTPGVSPHVQPVFTKGDTGNYLFLLQAVVDGDAPPVTASSSGRRRRAHAYNRWRGPRVS